MAENDKKPTTDLAKIEAGSTGLVLNSLEDMQIAAQLILQSGFCPDEFKKKEQVFVALQMGAELGLRPIQSVNSICIIRGKPRLWGDAALALVRKSGLLTKYAENVEGEGDEMIAKVVSIREGKFMVEQTFSVADAKTAGLWKKAGPWTTHPKRMLKYKARAFNLRDNFSDVLMGMHLAEEMYGEEDLPPTPECETQPRAQRRRPATEVTVTSTEPPPEEPGKSAELPAPEADGGATTEGEGAGTADETFTTTEFETDPDGPASPINVSVKVKHEEIVALFYKCKGLVFSEYEDDTEEYGKFIEFAAETLVREEDECDSPEKFDLDMLAQLEREIKENGV